MDLSPFRRNFEKIRNWQKYYHILKEHPKLSIIAKFGCKMLYTIENIALRIWQIFYTFVLVGEAEVQKYMFTYHTEGQFHFMFILYL